MKSETTCIAGLSLGLPQDFTALAVVERTRAPDPDDPCRAVKRYALRLLQRFPPATPYGEMCELLGHLFAQPSFAKGGLAVDYTGAGTAVLEVLRKGAMYRNVRPILITAGRHVAPNPRGGWSVPRCELAGTLQVLLQSRRLRIAQGLAEGPTLVGELASFQVREVAAADNTAVGPWRQGPQDDLVLAVAVACWLGEHALRQLVVWV
jgi:hypothetical protein